MKHIITDVNGNRVYRDYLDKLVLYTNNNRSYINNNEVFKYWSGGSIVNYTAEVSSK